MLFITTFLFAVVVVTFVVIRAMRVRTPGVHFLRCFRRAIEFLIALGESTSSPNRTQWDLSSFDPGSQPLRFVWWIS